MPSAISSEKMFVLSVKISALVTAGIDSTFPKGLLSRRARKERSAYPAVSLIYFSQRVFPRTVLKDDATLFALFVDFTPSHLAERTRDGHPVRPRGISCPRFAHLARAFPPGPLCAVGAIEWWTSYTRTRRGRGGAITRTTVVCHNTQRCLELFGKQHAIGEGTA